MSHLLVADDHPLYRMALIQAIRGIMPECVISEAEDQNSVMAQLENNPDTDVVLLDLHMPGCHGLMGLASIRAEHPGVAVIIISAHENPVTIRRALDYGAVGYLTKRTGLSDLKSSLNAVLSCQEWLPASIKKAVSLIQISDQDRTLDQKLASLSPQQFKVLTRVTKGLLNKQIADQLGIQERTVKAHMSAIFEKLDVRNRTQAGVLLRSLELTDPNSAVD
ncbi:MAG: response regulator transcription factor [Arenimonas sp.]|nr:response regulator transcription factor [Arenimonas sp.]MBP7981509.1 response regulator transcription factor [Arenimonas sp.]